MPTSERPLPPTWTRLRANAPCFGGPVRPGRPVAGLARGPALALGPALGLGLGLGLALALALTLAIAPFPPFASAVRAETPKPAEPAATITPPAPDGPAGTATAAELFQDADLAQGEALIAEGDCTACHIRNVGGDGLAIYRPQGRISSPSFLRGMVEYCNTQLNLQLFPEDVSSIAAVLNRDHYHFK